MIPETLDCSLVLLSHELSPVGCGGLAPVLANVEGLGVEATPAQVPGQLGPDVCLPSGGHPHHRDHMRHRAVPGAVPRGDLPVLLLRHDLDLDTILTDTVSSEVFTRLLSDSDSDNKW